MRHPLALRASFPSLVLLIVTVIAACSSSSPATGEAQLRLDWPEPVNLDPAIAADATSLAYVVEIFGGLLTVTPEFEIAADLATTVPDPEFREDGSVSYLFNLRPEAVFHDGRQVSAKDVAWSIERALHPDTLSITAPIFLSGISGADPFMSGDAASLRGVRLLNDRQVAIDTVDFDPDFLFKLAFPTAFVVDRSQIESDPATWAQRPNATGPFAVEDWILGEELSLRRNDDYHLDPSLTSRVVVKFGVANSAQRLAGDFDVVRGSAEELQSLPDGFSLASETSLSWSWLGFNTGRAPFDDARLRRALAMGLDPSVVADVVSAEPAIGFVSPRMPGFDADLMPMPFDPERGRATIARLGLEGLSITLSAAGGGITPEIVLTTIAAQWEQNLGIRVVVEFIDPPTLFATLQDGQFDAFVGTSTPAFPSISEVLTAYFQSDAPRNFTRYDSEAVGNLMGAAAREQNPDSRARTFREAHQLILNDSPAIPLFHHREAVAVRERARGYSPAGGIVPILRFVSVIE